MNISHGGLKDITNLQTSSIKAREGIQKVLSEGVQLSQDFSLFFIFS